MATRIPRATKCLGLAMLLVTGTSCLNDDNRFQEPEAYYFKLYANISGLKDSSVATTAKIQGEDLVIAGYFGTSRRLEMRVVGKTPTGTANFGGGAPSYASYSINGSLMVTDLIAPSGSITFTTRTGKRATGTFNVTLTHLDNGSITPPIVITDGAFDVDFTKN